MPCLQADLFKILGVETRLRIIDLLRQRGSLGVKEISDTLGITAPAVSQHLKLLKHAGLVRNERKGYWIPYELNAKALEQCGQLLSRFCTCGCKGAAGKRNKESGIAAEDELALLRRWEQELQRELTEIRKRIRELASE